MLPSAFMKNIERFSRCILVLLAVLCAHPLRAQGPPYQTDDPVPVDYKHYEFYIFGAADGTPVGDGLHRSCI